MSGHTLDSSCWIELIANRPGASLVEDAVIAAGCEDDLTVPSIVVFEVRRWAIRQGYDADEVDVMCGTLNEYRHVALDADVAARAAHYSISTGLGLADAVILTTARMFDAPLITFDTDFDGLPGATVLER